ncbi:hypothetical protein L227DRAFT_564225 [Lentinus tigrinus ALCF2SS1-6]|uniref:CMP/dCMP-type deaminase domain-containing protein n=1 Tax=Lentinus tigrinus ALCF2SS1-6 TaxID=1328759 RepID=A0A5C2S5X0_9APHY|nr:hypothetical protein L227DRAFT_564225 [Lentinus tigrinus ALCF2SS1-6]
MDDEDHKGEASSMFDAFADGDPDHLVPEEELPFRRLKLTPEDEDEEDMDAVQRCGDLLKLKLLLWPTIYTPRKKFEPEPRTRGKVQWACDAMEQVVKKAQDVLPIAAYVPVAYDEETRTATRMLESISAHDTRKSTSHPLRHSILNLVRAVASASAATAPMSPPPQLTPVINVPAPSLDQVTAALTKPHTHVVTRQSLNASESHPEEVRNGAHYLLTSLTLFTTHEPCIMCSMALLHSRVKEVFYLIPMAKTGMWECDVRPEAERREPSASKVGELWQMRPGSMRVQVDSISSSRSLDFLRSHCVDGNVVPKHHIVVAPLDQELIEAASRRLESQGSA